MPLAKSFENTVDRQEVYDKILDVWTSQLLHFISAEKYDADKKLVLDVFNGQVMRYFMEDLPKIYNDDTLFSLDDLTGYYGSIASLKDEAEGLTSNFLDESLATFLLSWAQKEIMANFSLPDSSELLQAKVLERLDLASAFWHGLTSISTDVVDAKILEIKEQLLEAFISSAVLFKKPRYVSKYANALYLGAFLGSSVIGEVLLTTSMIVYAPLVAAASLIGTFIYYYLPIGKSSAIFFQ